MPVLVRLLPALRLLPVRLFDQVVDLAGVNVSMNDFTGRSADGT